MGSNSLRHHCNLYLANLRFFAPDAADVVCPTCAEFVAADQLSRGHAFPAGSYLDGGVVPECRRCNSELGSKADEPLTHFLRLVRAGHGDRSASTMIGALGPRRMEGSVGGVPVRFSYRVKSGRLDVRGYVKQGYALPNPEPGQSMPITMNTRMPDLGAATAGILHSAMLRAFYMLGYEYMLNANLDPLRDDFRAIRDTDVTEEQIGERFKKYHNLIAPVDVSHDWQYVHLYAGPRDRHAFAFIMPVLPPNRCWAVALPGYGEEGARFWRRWYTHPESEIVTLHAKGYDLGADRENRMRDLARQSFARQLWNLTVAAPETA